MSRTGGADVRILGAGAAGLFIALRLAEAGLRVDVIDDGGASASAAAAGMLAPAAEAMFDAGWTDDLPAGLAALRLWQARAAGLGLAFSRSGSLCLAPPGEFESLCSRATALGLVARSVNDVPTGRGGLLLASDAVIDPAAALAALRGAAVRRGVRFVCEAEEGGERVRVIAAGWGSASLSHLAPELGLVRPIRGQLLRLPGEAAQGPVLRGEGVYLAPQKWGWVVGATMEPGKTDLTPDPAISERLLASAAALRPGLAALASQPAVGVRAETPDQAPMVGWSASPGVLLATGLRRNGWLLAPLVAEGIAAYLAGGDADAALAGRAAAWAPTRAFPT